MGWLAARRLSRALWTAVLGSGTLTVTSSLTETPLACNDQHNYS